MNLTSLRENLTEDLVLQNYGIVNQSFFVVRRNLAGLGFKAFLTENGIAQIHEFFAIFLKRLPIEYQGNLSSCEEKDFEVKIKGFLENFSLKSLGNMTISKEYAFGTKLFVSNSKELQILTNYEDHLLIVYQYKVHSIMKAISNLEKIMKFFEKTLEEFEIMCSYRNDVGFLTVNPNYAGLGVSLSYTLKLREKGPNEMQLELDNV